MLTCPDVALSRRRTVLRDWYSSGRRAFRYAVRRHNASCATGSAHSGATNGSTVRLIKCLIEPAALVQLSKRRLHAVRERPSLRLR